MRLAESTEQVIAALEDSVREGRRLVVTSGGHCLEGFVSDPDARVILDVSPMKRIGWDASRGAVSVEAGATVGETFRALFENWRTVVPLGEFPGIGIGGHVAGGAFGFLCRQLGLAADFLEAIEVVVVDHAGRAQPVVVTREPSDPNHDLWWAHTGAGGGNFGVITRCWFRSPDAASHEPADSLPRAPESVTTFRAEWDWSGIDRGAFSRLLAHHGSWCERNSDADSPNTALWTLLELHRRQFGTIIVRGVSTAGERARSQIEDHLGALSEGIPSPEAFQITTLSWLEFALDPFPDMFAMPPGGVSVKVKDALLRRRLDDRQIGVAYEHLTDDAHDIMGGMLGFATYGGRINAVAPHATASAQRASILDMACTTGWLDPREAEENLSWVRTFYRALFAESGGVPLPGERYEGSLINHPDVDHADPTLNASGVPWHTLYYQDAYPRLQRTKARWDPGNVFRHALSIRLP